MQIRKPNQLSIPSSFPSAPPKSQQARTGNPRAEQVDRFEPATSAPKTSTSEVVSTLAGLGLGSGAGLALAMAGGPPGLAAALGVGVAVLGKAALRRWFPPGQSKIKFELSNGLKLMEKRNRKGSQITFQGKKLKDTQLLSVSEQGFKLERKLYHDKSRTELAEVLTQTVKANGAVHVHQDVQSKEGDKHTFLCDWSPEKGLVKGQLLTHSMAPDTDYKGGENDWLLSDDGVVKYKEWGRWHTAELPIDPNALLRG